VLSVIFYFTGFAIISGVQEIDDTGEFIGNWLQAKLWAWVMVS